MNKIVENYKESQISALKPLDLILMLYNGAIQYLEQAKKGIRENNVSLSQEGFERARKIILHLYSTLDLERGGEIALNLRSMYAFMIEKILTANATKNEELVNQVLSLLTTIKDGWERIDLKDKSITEEMKKISESKTPLISVQV